VIRWHMSIYHLKLETKYWLSSIAINNAHWQSLNTMNGLQNAEQHLNYSGRK
jgi:hypothetical protein